MPKECRSKRTNNRERHHQPASDANSNELILIKQKIPNFRRKSKSSKTQDPSDSAFTALFGRSLKQPPSQPCLVDKSKKAIIQSTNQHRPRRNSDSELSDTEPSHHPRPAIKRQRLTLQQALIPDSSPDDSSSSGSDDGTTKRIGKMFNRIQQRIGRREGTAISISDSSSSEPEDGGELVRQVIAPSSIDIVNISSDDGVPPPTGRTRRETKSKTSSSSKKRPKLKRLEWVHVYRLSKVKTIALIFAIIFFFLVCPG